MARWKARIKLPICHNWTFFASSYRWGATRQNVSRLAAIRRGSLGAKISKIAAWLNTEWVYIHLVFNGKWTVKKLRKKCTVASKLLLLSWHLCCPLLQFPWYYCNRIFSISVLNTAVTTVLLNVQTLLLISGA